MLAAAIAFYGCNKKDTQKFDKSQNAEIIKKRNDSLKQAHKVNPDTIKPRIFSADEEKEVLKYLKGGVVTSLRHGLDDYISGKANSEYIEETAYDYGDDGLKHYDKEYYKSRFFVVNSSDGIMGGVFLDIIFVDKPDRVFKVWMYKFKHFRIRNIYGKDDETGDYAKESLKYYKNYIGKKEFLN